MPIQPNELPKKLFAEKSIYQLCKTYESVFIRPILAKVLCAFSIMVFSIFSGAYLLSEPKTSELIKLSSAIASFSLVLAGSLFGVAIAGFAIFASSINAKVLVKLVETNRPNTDINNLQFMYSMFTYVLVTIFSLFVTNFLFILFLSENSALFGISHELNPPAKWRNALLSGYSVLQSAQIVFVFSILKSFIWNLHQVLMIISGAQILEEIKNPSSTPK